MRDTLTKKESICIMIGTIIFFILLGLVGHDEYKTEKLSDEIVQQQEEEQENNNYTSMMKVIYIDKNNIVTMCDNNGEEYICYANDLSINDVCKTVMSDNGTEDSIYDDELLQIVEVNGKDVSYN